MRALAMLAQQLQFCTDLLSELGYGVGSVRCLEDNSSVVLQAGGDSQAAKSSHYRRDQAYVDEYVNAGKMHVDKVDCAVGFHGVWNTAVRAMVIGTSECPMSEHYDGLLRQSVSDEYPEAILEARSKNLANN